MPPGKVWIAAMNMRGAWAEQVDKASIKVNVTSAQAKGSRHRLAFSPMTPVEGGYKGYWNFESYWQSGKKFRGVPIEKSRKWWRSQCVPRRRYPGAKGLVVEHAEFEGHPPLDYVQSRKRVYVPEYSALIKDRPELAQLRDLVASGRSVTVYDFDGPRAPEDNAPLCLEVTPELLTEKLHDTRHPFGHGYVMAASIAGIPIPLE